MCQSEKFRLIPTRTMLLLLLLLRARAIIQVNSNQVQSIRIKFSRFESFPVDSRPNF
jgi:hypothetical protein